MLLKIIFILLYSRDEPRVLSQNGASTCHPWWFHTPMLFKKSLDLLAASFIDHSLYALTSSFVDNARRKLALLTEFFDNYKGSDSLQNPVIFSLLINA